jgi:hypothetical protein
MVYLHRFARMSKVTGQIIRGERRQHVVTRIMDNLKDWRSSPFENEASTRTGLRFALVMQGHRWGAADAEAGALVAEALRRVGAVRPSWEQGQREYLIPEENCNWCARELPDEIHGGLRKGRYCDAVCAAAAIQHREYVNTSNKHWSIVDAFRTIERDKQPSRICQHCASPFKPYTMQVKDQKYCSHQCAAKARRRIPERACETCGTMFRPKQAGKLGLYCSQACHYSRELPAKTCMCCDKEFRPHSPVAIFCSTACNKKAWKARKALERKRQREARPNVIAFPVLTPAVFDGWFKKAA